MKALYNFVLAALVVLATGACTEKYAEYEKGELPEGAQAFFGKLPASYDLTEANGTFSVTASRGNASGEAVVSLSSEADELFAVPSSVTFADGSKTADIKITYDVDKLVPDVVYEFTIAMTDNITPYADSLYTFTAGAVSPQEWTVFKKATFTEGWWGETHYVTIKYQEEETEDGVVRYCIVEGDEECTDTCAAGSTYGGVWGTGADFEFIWYLDKLDENGHQVIEVPGSYIYSDSVNGDVYAFDTYHGYNDVLGYDDGTFWDYMKSYPGENCYYDGNGGFYFNLMYLIPAIANGWLPDAYDVVAVCDGFIRTTDYNKDFEYAPLYDGEASSMMFTLDGENPEVFAQPVQYNFDYEIPEADEDGKVPTVYTEYYLPDYFAAGHGLAFIAPVPEQLTDGAAITNVKNAQETGIVVFGNAMYANVNKGTVTFPEGSDYPVFTIKVATYSLDANGNRNYSFGPFEDVIAATGYTDYNYRQLSPKDKAFYCGTFDMTYESFDGAATLQVVIADDGKDDQGNEWLAVRNLTGLYDYGMDDVVYALWSDGVVYLEPQDMALTYPYKGTEYPMDMTVINPYTGDEAPCLIGGYVEEDDAIAFVAAPKYENCSAIGFNIPIGTLAVNANMVLTPAVVEPEEGGTPAPEQAPKLMKRQPLQKPASEVVMRQFNASTAVPFIKYEKNLPEPKLIRR